MSDKPVSSGHYDQGYYLESCGGVEFFKRFGAEVLKPQMALAFKEARVEAGMRVLDVGCGRGELLLHVRRAGAFGTGVDYSPQALSLARETSKAPVALCDAKALPFKDKTFDRIFLLGIVDHLHDWELEKLFAELGRVLAEGGSVLAQTCTNRRYYKRGTYAALRWLKSLGLPIREPRKPRSEEDERLHVNEHAYGDLERFFESIGWRCEIRPVPNFKYLVGELYGEELPEGFPLKPIEGFWRSFYLGALFRFPLDRVLAREFFVQARPGPL